MERLNIVLIYISLLIISLYNVGIVEGIIDGETPAFGQLSNAVSIQVSNIHVCGGTLIHGEFVLTAANCLVDMNNRIINRIYTVVVHALEIHLDPNRSRLGVHRIYIPTAFNPHNISSGDIAVLELVEMTDLLSRLFLPQLPERIDLEAFEGIKTVSGYGLSITDRYDIGRDITDICRNRCVRLRYAKMNIIPKRECHGVNGENVDNNIICAKVRQRHIGTGGMCYGDAGNALISGNIIIGILIRNLDDCNETHLPAYYSSVLSSMPFLSHVIDNPITQIESSIARYAYYNRAGNIIEV